jgi:hypothetical protein
VFSIPEPWRYLFLLTLFFGLYCVGIHQCDNKNLSHECNITLISRKICDKIYLLLWSNNTYVHYVIFTLKLSFVKVNDVTNSFNKQFNSFLESYRLSYSRLYIPAEAQFLIRSITNSKFLEWLCVMFYREVLRMLCSAWKELNHVWELLWIFLHYFISSIEQFNKNKI